MRNFPEFHSSIINVNKFVLPLFGKALISNVFHMTEEALRYALTSRLYFIYLHREEKDTLKSTHPCKREKVGEIESESLNFVRKILPSQ